MSHSTYANSGHILVRFLRIQSHRYESCTAYIRISDNLLLDMVRDDAGGCGFHEGLARIGPDDANRSQG
jgi:hypothetical protein